MKVIVPISFDDERDLELLRRLRAEPRSTRSAVVRRALTEHYRLVHTLDDVYRQLQALRDLADRGALQQPAPGPADEPEPEDLADALDKLGT
jgi:hypothetical protein